MLTCWLTTYPPAQGLTVAFDFGSGTQVIAVPFTTLEFPVASWALAWTATRDTVLLVPCAATEGLAEPPWPASQPDSGHWCLSITCRFLLAF